MSNNKETKETKEAKEAIERIQSLAEGDKTKLLAIMALADCFKKQVGKVLPILKTLVSTEILTDSEGQEIFQRYQAGVNYTLNKLNDIASAYAGDTCDCSTCVTRRAAEQATQQETTDLNTATAQSILEEIKTNAETTEH